MVDDLKAYAERMYTDAEFEEKRLRYRHAMPFTKESLLYREIFERHYPGQSEMIVDFWMPNRAWQGCDVNDPSARVLSNYGASGVSPAGGRHTTCGLPAVRPPKTGLWQVGSRQIGGSTLLPRTAASGGTRKQRENCIAAQTLSEENRRLCAVFS